MRFTQFLTIFILLMPLFIMAQPPGFTNLPVSLNCQSTFPLCDIDSSYSNMSSNPNANVPPSFCGAGSVGNNAQWIQYYAGTSAITFHFEVYNCTQVPGQNGLVEGLQIVAYSSDNCTNYDNLGPCVSSGGTATPSYNVQATGMTPGFCYFLLIDGWAGSACEYEITITNGSTIPPPIVIGGIQTNIPSGDLTTGCAINFNVAPQGDCVLTDWTTTGGVMNEGQYSSSIIFSNPGSYTICFDAQYENTTCQPPEQECVTVVVNVPVHTPKEETLCPGESLTLGNQTFSSTTFTQVILQNQFGCDSIIDLDLTVLTDNDLKETVDSTICKGDSVYVNNLPYWTTLNNFNITFPSNTMSTLTGAYCDSTVRLSLTVLDPKANIAPTAGISCSGDSITLIGTPGFPPFGATQSVQWYYNMAILPGATSNNLNVADPGEYIYEVTIEKNGFTCSLSDTIDVTMSIGGVDANAGPDGMITCLSPTLLLMGSTIAVGNLEYSWTTDTGFIESGANTLTPLIGADGCYFLEIYDVDQNCSGYDTVCVVADSGIPEIMVSPDTSLSCNLSTISISGIGSSVSPNIIYTWSGPSPSVNVGNEHNITINIDQGGLYTLNLLDTSNGCPASAGLMVVMDTISPIAIAGPDTTLSCTDTIVPLISIGSSSYNNGFTYEWSGPGITSSNVNDQHPLVNTQGIYTLLITDDSNGCTSEDVAIVGLSNDFPVANAGADQILNCYNNVQVNVDGSGSDNGPNFNIEWTGPGINAGNMNQVSPSVVDSGWYYLTVTNETNGCFMIDSMEVTIDTITPMPQVLSPNDIMCNPAEVMIDASTSTPAGVSYSWSGPGINVTNQNDATPVVNVNGDYFLTITNAISGCYDTTQINVGIDTLTAIVTAVGDTMKCEDLNVTLMGSADLANVTFYWINPVGDTINAINPAVTSIGEYVLHVINNDNGCVSSESTLVIPDNDAPNINVFGGNIDCDSLTAMITALSDSLPVIYEWDLGSGIVTGSSQTVTDPGTYYVTITNTENGCDVDGQVTVLENINNPDVVIIADGEFDCDTKVVNLMANVSGGSGNYTYDWTTPNGEYLGATNIQSPSIGMPGEYQVIVKDVENGCMTPLTFFADENMTFPTPEQVIASNINCYSEGNGTIQFVNVVGGVGPYTYSIDDGESFSATPNFFLLDPGVFYIQVQDAFGCTFEDSVIIEEPQELLIDLGPDFFIDLGDSTTLVLDINNPGTVETIIWEPSLDSCFTADCTTLYVGPYEATIYTVTVIDENGCQATDQVLVKINKDRKVYFPTGFYPNSSIGNNIFMVQSEIGQVKNINKMIIFDRWGENVFENKDFLPNDPSEGWNGTLDGKPLNTAVFMYVVEVEYIDGTIEFFKGDVTLVN